MPNRAIFFDRDNTLIVSDGYLGDANLVKLVEGAAAAVARARELGFFVVTISNQSGVARGLFGEEAVIAVNSRMDELLRHENAKAVIDRHEFCPFHPQAVVAKYRQDSNLRKPKPGMLLSAAKALRIDLAASWVIGDAPRDMEAGQEVGCRTILFVEPTLPKSPATEGATGVEPDAVVASLAEAMDFIAAAVDS
jgi:D-glycero-D-manno-heptose 1,7-bisphosphate phosphatase